MDLSTIKHQLNLLKTYELVHIDKYLNYLHFLATEKNRQGQLKNQWIKYTIDNDLINYFKTVEAEGLHIDGKHITIQSTGLSYDYIAYKNKMLIIYPESTFDIGLVYKDDEFVFQKESGKVKYSHHIKNPFGQSETDIIGGYCVIKNKRGEFLTLMNCNDIEKCRKVAKTDYIWANWLAEMYKKTIVKKACKIHFEDIFCNIETVDNKNYDLEKPLDIAIETKQEIEAIDTIDGLMEYYHANKEKHVGVAKGFNKALADRKAELSKKESTNENKK
jgi:hypothetical protein